MKVKEVFEKSVSFFRDKNIPQPRFEVELLLASVLQTDRVGIYLKYEAPLSEKEIQSMRELVLKKSKGEPTAYLLGEKYFYGRPFKVGSGVLIPRPETEQLIEEALSYIKQKLIIPTPPLAESSDLLPNAGLTVADLGTGSGCIGLTIGLECPLADITLVEQSATAISFAQQNGRSLVPLGDQHRFHFYQNSVENFIPTHLFSLIVANPPYIAEHDTEIQATVKAFEPSEALFAPQEGLYSIRTWLNFVEKYLAPGGMALFEIGYKQGAAVKELFQSKNNFQSLEIIKDFNQRDRIIRAVKYG